MRNLSGYFGQGLASVLLAAGLSQTAAALPSVSVSPIGTVDENVKQIEVNFGEIMEKSDAFSVTCSPAAIGFSSWAANNTVWTFTFDNLKGEALEKGTKCSVEQTRDLKTAAGEIVPAGSIVSNFAVRAPKVTKIIPAPTRSYTRIKYVKENEPVFLIQFDGPVLASSVLNNAYENYVHYTGSNSPQEGLALKPVPADQAKDVFEYFKEHAYIYGTDYDSSNWVLATLDRKLVANSEINVRIGFAQSLYNPDMISGVIQTGKFLVRDHFKGQLNCQQAQGQPGTCLPNMDVTFKFNAETPWKNVKDAYIEYVPYGSEDGLTVTKEAKSPFEDGESWYDALTGASDTKPVSALAFDVAIAPETQFKIVLPQGLKDIEGRWFQGSTTLAYQTNSVEESYVMPYGLAVYEKNLPNVAFRLEAVNLNQTVTVTRSGTEQQVWAAISKPQDIIDVMKKYKTYSDGYRNTPRYRSPLALAGEKLNTAEIELDGERNEKTILTFPFAGQGARPKAGLYAIEVSSEAYLAKGSRPEDDVFVNPKYSLAQVTDLSPMMKAGADSLNVWVTSLSEGSAVAGAKVSVYDCAGEKISSYTTDSEGLVSFAKPETQDCPMPEGDEYNWELQELNSGYFVFVEKADDITFLHSSWRSWETGIASSPSVENAYSEVTEGQAWYHAVVSRNVVKPGQNVPVQLIATLPTLSGFETLSEEELPVKAVVTSYANSDVKYEFNLSWSEGMAEFDWQVLPAPAAELGGYSLTLVKENGNVVGLDEMITVAEYQVPLMNGSLTFAEEISKSSLPVAAYVQYANGLGAKNIEVDISYFFDETFVSFEGFESYLFSYGPVNLERDQAEVSEVLPTEYRPAQVNTVATDKDGNVRIDLASQKLSSGQLVSEALSEVPQVKRMIVRAVYPDQNGEAQTLSASKKVFSTEKMAGVHLVQGPKAEAKLQVVAVDQSGKAVTSSSQVETTLQKIETNVIGEILYGGLIKNRVEKSLVDLDWQPNCSLSEEVVSCGLGQIQAGSYAFSVKVEDSETHVVFQVNRKGNVFRHYYYGGESFYASQVALELDKELYQPGDIAQLKFDAPYEKCSAWVTLERSDVVESFVDTQACANGSISVKLADSLAPNAFISAVFFTGRVSDAGMTEEGIDLGRPSMKAGYANAVISTEAFVSEMTITTEKSVYAPQELVVGQVDLDDSSINEGYVTVVAIEANLLKLFPNDSYDIVSEFLQKRGHGVQLIAGLDRVASTAAGNEAPIIAESVGRDKDEDEGGDGGILVDNARKDFDSLVEFSTMQPVVNGSAKFEFKTNDLLAKFKLIAIYVNPAKQFGYAEAEFLAEKSTQVASNLPVTSTTGDSFVAKVNVQNNTKAKQTFKVQLAGYFVDADGNKVGAAIDSHTQVELDSVASESGEFAKTVSLGNVVVPEGAVSATYKVDVIDSEGSVVDSIVLENTRVNDSTPLRTYDLFIAQTNAGQMQFKLKKPDTALTEKGEITLSVQTSLVDSAAAVIAEKISASEFASLFYPSELVKSLVEMKAGKTDAIKLSLAKLVSMTDSYGLVKYSKSSREGSLGLTLNVMSLLAMSPESKQYVPGAVLNKWNHLAKSVLSKEYSSDLLSSDMDWFKVQAKVVRVADFIGDLELTSSARSWAMSVESALRADGNVFGESYLSWSSSDLVLLVSVLNYREETAGSLVRHNALEQLSKAPRIQRSGQMASVAGRPSWGVYYTDETITSAELLTELVKTDADNLLVQGLAIGLMNASNKAWYNVVTMGYILGALEQFAAKYEAVEVKGDALITVKPGSDQLVVDTEKKEALSSLTVDWTGTEAVASVEHGGEGEVWFSAQTKVANQLTQPFDQGLKVRKTVRNMNSEDVEDTEVRDLLEVELTVTASVATSSVALFDPIPSGAVILGKPTGAWFANTQTSYDGVKVLFSSLGEGETITVKYQYRVNNSGSFKLAPTRAEALYDPATYSESPNATMIVK